MGVGFIWGVYLVGLAGVGFGHRLVKSLIGFPLLLAIL